MVLGVYETVSTVGLRWRTESTAGGCHYWGCQQLEVAVGAWEGLAASKVAGGRLAGSACLWEAVDSSAATAGGEFSCWRLAAVVVESALAARGPRQWRMQALQVRAVAARAAVAVRTVVTRVAVAARVTAMRAVATAYAAAVRVRGRGLTAGRALPTAGLILCGLQRGAHCY
ncbi:unnamed protein product [Closterium sp. NIES-53]